MESFASDYPSLCRLSVLVPNQSDRTGKVHLQFDDQY